VVTCTPPWQYDLTCTTADAQDDNTRLHDAPCLHEPPKENDMPPPPAVTVDSDGKEWVFVRGTNGALFAQKENLGWISLGGIITSGPDAMATADGRIIVVARGNDGATWRIIRDNKGNWGGWTSLGGLS
jgi:hypothetical protein